MKSASFKVSINDVLKVKFFKLIIFFLKSFFTNGKDLLISLINIDFCFKFKSNAVTFLLCANILIIQPVPITPVPTTAILFILVGIKFIYV